MAARLASQPQDAGRFVYSSRRQRCFDNDDPQESNHRHQPRVCKGARVDRLNQSQACFSLVLASKSTVLGHRSRLTFGCDVCMCVVCEREKVYVFGKLSPLYELSKHLVVDSCYEVRPNCISCGRLIYTLLAVHSLRLAFDPCLHLDKELSDRSCAQTCMYVCVTVLSMKKREREREKSVNAQARGWLLRRRQPVMMMLRLLVGTRAHAAPRCSRIVSGDEPVDVASRLICPPCRRRCCCCCLPLLGLSWSIRPHSIQ